MQMTGKPDFELIEEPEGSSFPFILQVCTIADINENEEAEFQRELNSKLLISQTNAVQLPLRPTTNQTPATSPTAAK